MNVYRPYIYNIMTAFVELASIIPCPATGALNLFQWFNAALLLYCLTPCQCIIWVNILYHLGSQTTFLDNDSFTGISNSKNFGSLASNMIFTMDNNKILNTPVGCKSFRCIRLISNIFDGQNKIQCSFYTNTAPLFTF